MQAPSQLFEIKRALSFLAAWLLRVAAAEPSLLDSPGTKYSDT